MKNIWNGEFVNMWINMAPPSKPSISEIKIYAEEIHKLKEKLKRKLDILILGSTTEFRDFAYEESMNVTIIDFSKDYYDGVSKKLKNKNALNSEKLVIKKWEDMIFTNEFDIIIGDCIFGNIKKERLEEFIERLKNALRVNGLFLCKTYLIPKNYKRKTIEEIVLNYQKNYSNYNPFSYMMFDLAMSSLKNNNIDFDYIYNKLSDLYTNHIISNDIFKSFKSLDLLRKVSFNFYVPNIEDYEELIKKYLSINNTRYGTDIYSSNFPIYIIEKKHN